MNLRSLLSITTDDMKIIWKWNGQPLQVVEAFAHHLIEQRAREQPDSVAVHSWEGDLTYAELYSFSSRLAAHLVKGLGVRPETYVPLCFEKSMWTVVAMLAVLKAEAAFVPLDPTHPVGRTQHVVSQVRAELVLSSSQLLGKSANLARIVYEVSHTSMEILDREEDFYLINSDVSSAAYVIFTSGSTGNPKGVVIGHRQLSTSSTQGGRAMGFASKPRMLQFASYTFDACILEIVTTLIYGAVFACHQIGNE